MPRPSARCALSSRTSCVVRETLGLADLDQVVGLRGEDAERLDKSEPGWKISGKYAVILLVRRSLA